MNLAQEYLSCVMKTFKSLKRLGDRALQQLDYSELHWTPNTESNSIAIIVKHLRGNMFSRWTDFLTSDGEKESRNRDDEFIDTYKSKEQIIHAWEEGWSLVFSTLSDLTEDDLLMTVYIRGEAHSVLAAIERQISHYAYHVGQIVYIGKEIKKEKWQCLSVPRGKSEEYNDYMRKDNK